MGSEMVATWGQDRKLKLSIIIPVYNEQATIAELIKRVSQVELEGIEKEIIIADDGSRDKSPIIIADLKIGSGCICNDLLIIPRRCPNSY